MNDSQGMIKLEQELMRIGVSLPENLLSRFDEVIGIRGYSSRSEGIRDAIRSYITHYEWMKDVKGERVGTISIVFNHHQKGLVESLAELEHEYIDMIRSSLHIHLDNENCLEVMVLKGEGARVKTVAERVMALKGVKHVKLSTTSAGANL